jgi:hypothetical protein
MRKKRHYLSQSTLADGRVLVCGGKDANNYLADADIYDPTTNAWTAASPMRKKRNGLSQSTLADGRVLVCGGFDGTNRLADADIYDPTTNVWTAASPMRKKRHGLSQSTLADGRVLVCGGQNNDGTFAGTEILEGDELTTAVVVRTRTLPPVPSTDSMLQAEKAATLREWLAAAEAVRLEAQLQLEDARKKIELQRDGVIAKAHEWFDDNVRMLERQLQERVAATNGMFNRQLERFDLSTLEEAEAQITRVRRQAEEAERLAAMLGQGDVSPAPTSPPLAAAGAAPPRQRPDEHLCSITCEVMSDPVMIECGDTFERSAIEEWFKDHDTCPYCRSTCNKDLLLPNRGIKKMIQDW